MMHFLNPLLKRNYLSTHLCNNIRRVKNVQWDHCPDVQWATWGWLWWCWCPWCWSPPYPGHPPHSPQQHCYNHRVLYDHIEQYFVRWPYKYILLFCYREYFVEVLWRGVIVICVSNGRQFVKLSAWHYCDIWNTQVLWQLTLPHIKHAQTQYSMSHNNIKQLCVLEILLESIFYKFYKQLQQ